ncbi:MAG: winged helix-turn-helix transcriptional regulator [Cyclobacteriaceae bacterium]|nr:winged helix-turn-helix transcriptional regulator [Cyclobacteriaceae bacterium]
MTTTAIAQVREFNRFYTRILGLLDKEILNSAFSLPEARVLYELHRMQPCSAKEIIQVLEIDKGYLSRILKNFLRKGLIQTQAVRTDTRVTEIRLSAKGKVEFEKLNRASANQIQQLLAPLTDSKIKSVISHMQAIRQLLNNHT